MIKPVSDSSKQSIIGIVSTLFKQKGDALLVQLSAKWPKCHATTFQGSHSMELSDMIGMSWSESSKTSSPFTANSAADANFYFWAMASASMHESAFSSELQYPY
jgi:hypothetical protein